MLVPDGKRDYRQLMVPVESLNQTGAFVKMEKQTGKGAPVIMPAKGIKIAILMTLILGLSAFNTRADLGLRCGTRLITTGDTIERVLNECGEPSHVESWEESRIHHHPYQYLDHETDFEKYGPVHRVIVHVTVEEWTYNHGPSRFIERVRFENGRVRKIANGGYGN